MEALMSRKQEKKGKVVANNKINDLAQVTEDGKGTYLTTNQGVRVNDDQNSLKAS